LVPAGLALLLLLTGLLARSAGLLGASLAVLGVEYVLGLEIGGASVRWTVAAYGVALLVLGELAYAALEPTAPLGAERAAAARRTAGIATLAVAGLAVGGIVEGVAAVRAGGGVPLTALGAAGAILVAALLLWLSRRAAEE
jgi:hypothetical protein